MKDDIVVYDEDGNEIIFKFLSAMEINSFEYVALVRVENGKTTDELHIMKYKDDNLFEIEDEDELLEVYSKFDKELLDDYDYE